MRNSNDSQNTDGRRRLSVLRLILGVLTGAVVMLALIAVPPFLSPPPPQVQPPVYQARIVNREPPLTVLATLDLETSTLRVERIEVAPAPGRSLQLWLVRPDRAAPVPLGAIDGPVEVLPVPEGLIGDGATLAVSDEPPGGSPGGTPTNLLGAGLVSLP